MAAGLMVTGFFVQSRDACRRGLATATGPSMATAGLQNYLGVADPTDVGRVDELRTKMGGAVSFVVVDQVDLHRALAREYSHV